MLDNTIIVFSSDNGGPAEGFNSNAASNWPLRGVKNTLWEGGVRAAGFIWSPLIAESRRVSQQMIHISDWLPTLLDAAGYNVETLPKTLDGINVWKSLLNGNSTERREILHNIDDIWGSAALTVNNWKVLKGTNYKGQWDNWYGPSGDRDPEAYNITAVQHCPTGKALSEMNLLPPEATIQELRINATVHCSKEVKATCNPLEQPCLYDVLQDPCELDNLAERFPAILDSMLKKLDAYNATAVPPGNLALDTRGDPRFWGFTWHNFGDDLEHCDGGEEECNTQSFLWLSACCRRRTSRRPCPRRPRSEEDKAVFKDAKKVAKEAKKVTEATKKRDEAKTAKKSDDKKTDAAKPKTDAGKNPFV
ncbi:hypothetical protein pipiens_000950, partial [Culex pipiens pipiens]